jgi:hypothetical protein
LAIVQANRGKNASTLFLRLTVIYFSGCGLTRGLQSKGGLKASPKRSFKAHKDRVKVHTVGG